VAESEEEKEEAVSDVTVYAVTGLSTAQDAVDAARLRGQELYEAGFVVGPPWYVPVPLPRTMPPDYEYEGRVRYGSTEDALINRFHSHLYEVEEDAINEAYELRDELAEGGYDVGSVGVQTRSFGGVSYYESVFYFGIPGAVIPEPFEEETETPWYVWALPISLIIGTVAVVVIGRKT
jgi:hypothetical protein